MCTPNMARLSRYGFALVLLAASPTLARDYLSESRIIDTPQSTTERFTFTLEKESVPPFFDLQIKMTKGRADLRIVAPDGRELERMGAQACTVKHRIGGTDKPGTYVAELVTADAVGQWKLRIYDTPSPIAARIGPGLIAAKLMLLVAVASVMIWRSYSGAAWRWFWAGAAIWTVSVIVKFAIAIPLNQPIIHGLKSSLPYWAYLTAGSVYGGLMTGVTEILFTLIAALIWRQLAASAARGVAVGVGAGAFEAALLAIAVVVGTLAKDGGGVSWSIALAPAIERAITILCHVASRALVLLAVARSQWILFWYGFLLLSGADAIATWLHLTGRARTMSPWAMEAMVLPFGLISIPITMWCIRRWPAPAPRAEPNELEPLTVSDSAGTGSADTASADTGSAGGLAE